MHNGALKKWALALTFWLALHTTQLKAQILGPYGSSPTVFEVDANGLLSDTGTYGTGSLSLSGAGTRMLWYPARAAFRAGYVSGTQWNDASLGPYSVAFGENAMASAVESVSFSGTATGDCAIAFPEATASGLASKAFGLGSNASGQGATAWGASSTASGYYSIALGIYSIASGREAEALGTWDMALGANSTVLNGYNTASGGYSTASGTYSTASAYASFVVGAFNVGGGSSTTWVATDPLFEIGNGGDGSYGNPAKTTTSDALVVYKNGNMTVGGVVTAQPGGDIPMYQGN